jgi:hypothetical protein
MTAGRAGGRSRGWQEVIERGSSRTSDSEIPENVADEQVGESNHDAMLGPFSAHKLYSFLWTARAVAKEPC